MSDNQAGENGNFFSWILNFFSGGSDPEREKKRLLRQLGKDLARSRYKFYRPRGNQALPGLGKFFFEIYKITASAGSLMQNAQTSQALRELCIEQFMTEEQKGLVDSFEEGKIRENARTMDPKVHAKKLKDDMVSFFSSFNSSTVSRIDDSYNRILRFIDFVNFDYYFVLKKFDATFQEGNITGSPKLETINGDYVSDDIKDFLEVLLPLDREADWDSVFDILAKYKGVEVVNRQAWSRLMNGLKNVVNQNILPMIVQHLDQDPYWKAHLELTRLRIVEGYMDALKTKTENVVHKILAEKRNAKVDQLCIAVFGANPTPRLKFYTEKANMMFSKKLNIEYLYITPLNYLKTFLLDFFKKDVRELEDLLLVRGKWSTNVMSQQMSDAYYRVLEMSEQLIVFDEGLNEEGEMGARLKRSLARVVEKEPASANNVKTMVNEINETALNIINESANNLISFGKNIKSLIEDVDRKDHELIINWKELEAMSEVPVKTRMADAYKKIYYFIQLMQMFVKPGRTEAAPEV
jgi:hypothetical protein